MIWDRDRLLMELGKFDSQRKIDFEEYPELQKYKAYYQLEWDDTLAVEHSMGWVEAGPFRVVLQSFRLPEPKASVFLFHGYFDHVGIYHHIIRFLLEHGFDVFIYDMPGHGLSSGTRTAITDFTQYQQVLNDVYEKLSASIKHPVHAVGQSTGGAVLVDHLSAGRAALFERVVLLSPLVRPEGWAFAKVLHKIIEPFSDVWRRTFSKNSNDLNFIDFLKLQDPLQSRTLSVTWVGALKKWVVDIERRSVVNRKLLVIQGDADKTVSWGHNLSVIRRLFEQGKVVHVQCAHHLLVNETEAIRRIVLSAMLSELDGG